MVMVGKLVQKQLGHVRVPWIKISEYQEDFIDNEFLPQVFTLTEPTRKQLDEKKRLLEFWLKRQADPNIKHAFLFKAYRVGDEMVKYNYLLDTGHGSHVAVQAKGKGKARAGSTTEEEKSCYNSAESDEESNWGEGPPAKDCVTMASLSCNENGSKISNGWASDDETAEAPADRSEVLPDRNGQSDAKREILTISSQQMPPNACSSDGSPPTANQHRVSSRKSGNNEQLWPLSNESSSTFQQSSERQKTVPVKTDVERRMTKRVPTPSAKRRAMEPEYGSGIGPRPKKRSRTVLK